VFLDEIAAGRMVENGEAEGIPQGYEMRFSGIEVEI
jgi:hypothetical protein